MNQTTDQDLLEAHTLPMKPLTNNEKTRKNFIFHNLNKTTKCKFLEIDSTLTVNCPINLELLETFRIANAHWFGCPLNSTEKYMKSAIPEARLSCDVLLNVFDHDKNEQLEIYAMSAVFMRRSPVLCGKIINARKKIRHDDKNRAKSCDNQKRRINCHHTVLNIECNNHSLDMTRLRGGLALVLYSLHGGKLIVTNENFSDIYMVSVLIGCSEITDALSEMSADFDIDFEKTASIQCVHKYRAFL